MHRSGFALILVASSLSLAGCAWPESVTGEFTKSNAPDEMPFSAFKETACDGEQAELDDGTRYYVFKDGDNVKLCEYSGPESTYMTCYTNGWTKPGESIFFVGDKTGAGGKVGMLFALSDGGEEGAVILYAGGRAGAKLKLEEQADGTYFPTDDSTAVGAMCLTGASGEAYPPAFAGPPPWAAFDETQGNEAEAG